MCQKTQASAALEKAHTYRSILLRVDNIDREGPCIFWSMWPANSSSYEKFAYVQYFRVLRRYALWIYGL